MPRRSIVFGGCLGLAAAAAIAMQVFTGPDADAGLELLPVRGVVLRGDKPLELRPDDFGKIWLHPEIRKGNMLAEVPTGDIAADGRFAVSTRGRAGAPAGWYRVALIVNRTRDPGHPNQKRKSLIPEFLGDPKTSGQTINVAADRAAGAYDIRIGK